MKKSKLYLWVVLAIWLVINVLQAVFTPLDPDEAYYWMYASSLDWGYFDHPPMVALFIKLGESLLGGTLGVRLFTILLQLGFLYILWLLCDQPNDKKSLALFFSLVLAMPLLQVYGFVATPDAPLLFFSALFLWTYRRFLQAESWGNTLLLGLVTAALLYSKYHGVLLIFFTLLSNLKLLTRPRFYLAGIFGFILFFPHLYWQYAHDFPSFRYHLKGRDDPYELKHSLNYLINQFVVFGPLVFPLLIRALWKNFPPKDPLQRAYFFILFGFWVFFFWTTFKGHVEPQWTIILCIPLVVLALKQYREDQKLLNWYLSLGGISLVLILVLRVALTIPNLNLGNLNRQFRHQSWVSALEARASGRPVVFQNSYRDASVYSFYTGQAAYTFTDIDYRKNQFDIWNREIVLDHQDILLAGKDDWKCPDCEWLKTEDRKMLVREVDDFQPVWKLESQITFPNGTQLTEGTVPLELAFFHPYPYTVEVQNPQMPMSFQALFYQNAEIQDSLPLFFKDSLLTIGPRDTVKIQANLQIPEQLKGTFDFYIGLQFLRFPPVFCSKASRVDIK